MRRKGILALALAMAGILVVGVGVALAAQSYSTKIVFLGNDGPSIKDQTLFGDLNSNSKCVGARKVGLYKQTSSGFKLIDVDLSSFNGAWAVRADLTGTPNLAIQVEKDRRNGGNVVCKAAAITLSSNSPNYPTVR